MSGLPSVSLSAQKTRNVTPARFALVIFGASGDLTARKLVPALFSLHRQGLLPERCPVVGFSRTEMSDDDWRAELREAIQDKEGFDAEAWDAFAARLIYHRGDYDRPADYAALRQQLEELARERDIPANWLFYLSTPPQQFAPVTGQLKDAGLSRKGSAEQPWSRIVIEKPFGHDLASARQLNEALTDAFDERQIFRIDHYLGKETVQNLLVMRFANQIFEPLWNHQYVDHVQITVAETLGVGERGSYYDRSGALRDMLQNHLLNLLCLVAMEPPVSLNADAIRDEKVKLLRAIRHATPGCAAYGVVRAQYGPGPAKGEPAPAYRQEEGVAEDSRTETFVALRLAVDNWRWSGVPFYLRTGKRLAERVSEIGIHFKPVPQVLFNAPPHWPQVPNVLTIRVQPNEGIAWRFQVKQPGPAMRVEPYQMSFCYRDAFGQGPPEAYERLILDAAGGDSTLFLRADEVDAAWAYVTPLLEAFERSDIRQLPQYEPGSWGPPQADALIAQEGNRWHITQNWVCR